VICNIFGGLAIEDVKESFF